MAKILIVDGHSAIFSYPDLAKAHRINARHARQELIQTLACYQDSTETSVVLVYDGRQSQQNHEGGTEGEILVIYSQYGATADSVIERIVGKQGTNHDILVASNDLAVRDTCLSLGAMTMSIRELFDLVDGVSADFRRKWGVL